MRMVNRGRIYYEKMQTVGLRLALQLFRKQKVSSILPSDTNIANVRAAQWATGAVVTQYTVDQNAIA